MSNASISFPILIIYFLLPLSAFSENLSLKQCSDLAAENNKYVPLQVSGNVTFTFSYCKPVTSERVALIYKFNIDTDATSLPYEGLSKDIKTLEERALNRACTTPDSRALLRSVDLGYEYYNNNNRYLFDFRIVLADCE